jgi:hypothetical protein
MAGTNSKKTRSSSSAQKRSASSKQKTSSGSSVFRKQILLLALAFVLLVGYISIGYTREWFRAKVLSSWGEFRGQKNKLSLEERLTTRFGNNYTMSKMLADFLKKRGQGKTLVLMPPNDYLAQNKILYKVPEPAIFYYFTGLKTVWASSEEAHKANWYVSTANGQMLVDSVTSQKQLDSVINKFRKYKISL